MDAFNSNYYSSLGLNEAGDYSNMSNAAVSGTVNMQDLMAEGQYDIPINPSCSEPPVIDYNGIVDHLYEDDGNLYGNNEDLFGDSNDSFGDSNEETTGELTNWALTDLATPQPIIPEDTTFALPPVIPETQPEIILAPQTYEYPPPPGTEDDPDSPVLETLTWDAMPGQTTGLSQSLGWNTPARSTLTPIPVQPSPYASVPLRANDLRSTPAKHALGAPVLLPNQQLATPPYSIPPSQMPSRAPSCMPPSQMPSRAPSCMPSRVPSCAPSRVGTPAPLGLGPTISRAGTPATLGLGLLLSRTSTPAPLALVPGKAKRADIIPARQSKGEINYAEYYDKLPETPAPWGGNDPLRPKFQYMSQGMWKPNLSFTRDDLFEYISSRHDAGAPLTVWLQNCPAGSNARCPDRGTRQCRFRDCPASSRSILKGWWRVAFDEHPEQTGKDLDPFHCAGFMHLYCFEKCFDLVEMMSAFDVQPDTRNFEREQKNFMALTRDHVEILEDVRNWRAGQERKWQEWQDEMATRGESGLARPLEREDHLWYVLTVAHMENESAARQSVRDQRGGSSIDKHQGDLDVYMGMKHAEKNTKAKALREAKAALAEKMQREQGRTSSKRARDDGDDGDDAEADADNGGRDINPQKVKARPMKRIRTRGTQDGETSPGQASPGTRRSPRMRSDSYTQFY
ncbi:hypothetical protein ACHAQH_004644 [Verticillium albo-atrum]